MVIQYLKLSPRFAGLFCTISSSESEGDPSHDEPSTARSDRPTNRHHFCLKKTWENYQKFLTQSQREYTRKLETEFKIPVVGAKSMSA